MPDELQELHEHAEEAAHQQGLAPVTVTMAVLAVLVAVVTLLGHRSHTEEILSQTRATDQWAYYQAKEIRRRSYELFLDQLSVFSLQPGPTVAQTKQKYEQQVARYESEQKDIEDQAKKAEDEVKKEERRADRYDLSEVLLEAALVICSITLLTRKRFFWGLGLALGIGGVAIGVAGILVR